MTKSEGILDSISYRTLLGKGIEQFTPQNPKERGMHWSEATADALAAMKTIMLNQAWDLYWVDQQILPLATTP
ncbi:hypothetical protein, partial [Acaryochloris sp. IP29b_bin.148]|uniref:hypothetical protein n=1 Tax=Acaryochloris sp. IP29b_bin.148 TaxID=2969218 RepID=UPI00261A2BB5